MRHKSIQRALTANRSNTVTRAARRRAFLRFALRRTEAWEPVR